MGYEVAPGAKGTIMAYTALPQVGVSRSELDRFYEMNEKGPISRRFSRGPRKSENVRITDAKP